MDLERQIAIYEERINKVVRDIFMNIVVVIDFIIKIVGQCIEIFIQKVIV